MPPKKSKGEAEHFVTIPQLNLFKKENLQVSIESVSEEELLPTASWNDASEITFNIMSNPVEFIDMSSLRIMLQARVLTQDGETIFVDKKGYAPISNFGGSLFEKVSVRLGNSTQISGLDNLYPYLTFLENVYKTPETTKKQNNFPYLLYQDTAVSFDRLSSRNNLGYASRQNACSGSKPLHISVPIICPITTQDKLLIPNVDVFIRMIRAQPNFLLMNELMKTVTVKRTRIIPATAGEAEREVEEDVEEQVLVDMKLDISNIRLFLRKYKLTPLLHFEIMNQLRLSPACYPCKYQQLIEFSRVQGTSVIRESLFSDRPLPKCVYLFVVSTRRRLGDYGLSPWFIDWRELSEIKLVSGGDSYPTLSFKPNHLHRDVNEMYRTMIRTTGSLEVGHSNGLNIGDYLGGYGLIAFDLSRTYLRGEGEIVDVPKVSDLQVHITFKTLLSESTSFIFVLEYDSQLLVQSNSRVTTDFL